MEPHRPEDLKEDLSAIKGLSKDVASSLGDVLKSEIQLAKLEVKDSVDKAKAHLTQVALFGAVGALGVLPLLAFCVIGLGAILGGNYWLSSLLVAVVCFAVGGGLALRAINRMKSEDLSLPHTRHSLENITFIAKKRRAA